MKDKRKQAEQLLRQGDYVNALKHYQQLLIDAPDDPDLLHIIGMLLARTDSYNEALTFVEKAIKVKPQFAPFYNSKGNVLVRLQRISQAITAYQHAIKLKPDYAIGHNSLGRCFYQQDKLSAAKKSYETAIKLMPQLSEAQYNYGVLLTKLGDNDDAIHALEKAITVNPNFPAAHGQIAQIYLQQHDYKPAIKHLLKRLQLQPNHADSYYDLGLAYLDSGDLEAATASLERSLALNSNHAEINHYLASAYLQSGDQEKALNYFFRQIEINPLPASYYNIGVLLMYKERHKEAIDYLKQSEALDPGYLPTHLNLGGLYLKLRATQEAIKHYKIAAKIKPDDIEIQHILTALTQTGTPKKAPTEYLEHLFDQYAQYYDKHLTEYLNYKVPQQLHQTITQDFPPEPNSWRILDLGCGTGLCGELFKEFSTQLIGVDIAAQMIENARQKQIYDELQVADIEQALDQYHDIDLILAADVFTYIGDLDTIFSKVHSALKSGGLFGFSVEKNTDKPFVLQQSIRYAHSRDYIESLIDRYHFKNVHLDNIILRKQKQGQIEGYLVLLQKRTN